MVNNNLIFVSIASYRDPELLPTLRDLFTKAKNPELLRIGLCWQRHESEDIGEFLYNNNVRIYECDWTESKGACWARHIIQKFLYEDEEFYFQLDSHHRFKEHWDEHLIKLYQEAPSEKPIIGGYATTYWPERPDEPLEQTAYRITTFDTFTEDGDIISRPQNIVNSADLKKQNIKLIPARLLSGHFIFTSGEFCKTCMYDPNLYFRGEEITLSARAYTHGYDMYHPTEPVVWHEYLRPKQHKHWEDHIEQSAFDVTAGARDIRSKQRQRILFGMEDYQNLDFKNYGFGNKRTLHEYELYAGLDFKNRRVHKYAARINDFENFPEPYVMSEEEWNEGMLTKYEITVQWDYDKIPDDVDYDFWFFGFEDIDNKLLWRTDFKAEEGGDYYQNFFTKKFNTHRAVFSCFGVPHHCVIIPHTRGGDWTTEKIIIEVLPDGQKNSD
jgi:hypothetical protein